MAVSSDMMRTWRKPREVMRKLLARGQREDLALAFLMSACVIIFVAQWPRLSRIAAGFDLPSGSVVPELSQLVAYEFLGWLLVWPLMFYVIGGISHAIAKLFGGQGTWYSARLALFWSLLATTPAALLYGLMAGFLGPIAAGTHLVGFFWLAAFAVIWLQTLSEAERNSDV